jgi:hypothetical protein
VSIEERVLTAILAHIDGWRGDEMADIPLSYGAAKTLVAALREASRDRLAQVLAKAEAAYEAGELEQGALFSIREWAGATPGIGE